MIAGVYEIINGDTGRCYIGSTKNFKRRWSEHRADLNSGQSHNPILQHAWNKYGPAAFEFKKLVICAPTKDQLLLYEQACLDAFKPEYNARRTAESNLGHKFPPEFGAAISKRNKGRKMTPEQRKKISLARTGFKHGPAFGKAISARNMGVKRGPFSEAHLANLSASKLGKPLPPFTHEHRERLASALRGKPKSPEAVAKSVVAKRRARAKRLELLTKENT